MIFIFTFLYKLSPSSLQPVKRTMSSINVASSVFVNIDEFPSLTDSIKSKKSSSNTSSPVHINLSAPTTDAEYERSAPRQKTMICKSVKIGVPCEYGTKCSFAHFIDELTINTCKFGDRCIRMNKTKNKDSTNACIYKHPVETEKMYLIRLGVKDGMMTRPVFNNSFTRMCVSVYDGVPCEKRHECTFAHTKEQLVNPSPCGFGNRCYHILVDDNGYYTNKTQEKTCMFMHCGETFENYEQRFLKPYALKSKEKKVIEFKSIPVFAEEPVQDPIEESKPVQDPIEESKHVQDPIEEFKPVQDEIIIDVPSHMAIEMLDILLKSGKTNVVLRTH